MSEHYYVRNRFLEACRWTGIAQVSIDLNSGYEEHRPRLTIILGRLYATVRLPRWVVQPHRRKVLAQTWDAATVARMGRDWYWDETRREFGISIAIDRLCVKYGVQPDSWPGDKSWSYYFPWMKWRSIENRWLRLDGAISEVVPEGADYEARTAAKERAAALRFAFKDFDGERIEARAFSTRFNLAGVSSSRARHTVGAEATDPSTSSWWRRVSISAIASPPPASMVATSTNTCPRSCPGTKPRRDRAPESSRVRPTCSASRRTAVPPA